MMGAEQYLVYLLNWKNVIQCSISPCFFVFIVLKENLIYNRQLYIYIFRFKNFVEWNKIS